MTDRSFRTFGIQGRAHESIDLRPLSSTATLDSPTDFLTGSNLGKANFVVGSVRYVRMGASLTDVRTIRVSFGMNGTSRAPEFIAGLWLDYYGTNRPSIIGQWFYESNAFELLPGEQFIKISIWTSNEFVAAYSGSAKLGTVIGIRFDTTVGRSFRFGRDCTAGKIQLNFSASKFEKLVIAASPIGVLI
jgi:hypothetical protein